MKENGRLCGRRVLVTGAASGIGCATAELFVAEGAQLALLDANAPAVHEVAQRIGARGFAADVADETAVTNAVNEAAQALGGLDGLVNAAGIFRFTPLANSDSSHWRRVLDVNVMGTVLVSRAALPSLQRATSATIVNISSIAGLRPSARSAAYAASKAAVIALTRALSSELGPNIRVNCVCPGTVGTPMQAAIQAEYKKPDMRGYVIPRAASPAEIAQGILYLTSAESAYVTGIALAIDGGRSFH